MILRLFVFIAHRQFADFSSFRPQITPLPTPPYHIVHPQIHTFIHMLHVLHTCQKHFFMLAGGDSKRGSPPLYSIPPDL